MDVFSTVRIAFLRFIRRNRINLGDLESAVEKEPVHLHYWRYCGEEKQNLGDYLSAVVVLHMEKINGVCVRGDTSHLVRHLYAVGSILQAGYQNATVWGSGFIQDPLGSGLTRLLHSSRLRKLDIRAVRGPLTRQALLALGHQCPEIYGDPAILMPRIYQPSHIEKTRKYVAVQHYVDKSSCDNTVDILTSDYRGFIDQLCSAERVISSSLHGIILAEAYGIPAVLYRPAEAECELPLFKYEDYYQGTGRNSFPIASTVDEALSLTPCELPDFTEQADALAAAFPRDLWM